MVMPQVLALYLRPSARTPVRAVPLAQAITDQGLDGDHAVGGRRQVTLLDIAAWNDACRETGVTLDPSHRRANIVVEGIDLAASIGQVLRIGTSRLQILGETRPCELLDDSALGLNKALRPHRRGGVYGRVLEGGPIRIDDPVSIESSDA